MACGVLVTTSFLLFSHRVTLPCPPSRRSIFPWSFHSIPEGVAVAMPIYYATGSKTKAFFWASLSGMTELIGAALGWVVLRKVFNQLVYGILFGLISGMMVRSRWATLGRMENVSSDVPCLHVAGGLCARLWRVQPLTVFFPVSLP